MQANNLRGKVYNKVLKKDIYIKNLGPDSQSNISNAGVPVNIAYGEILVGSIVVSNGVDTVQVEGTN